ncbi:MAG: hypothetical protein HXY37_19265 [Chloroflexi bacterium]|nr:hypothetical protein [Chloroflexota bacterium]
MPTTLLGAVGEVTGTAYLVTAERARVLRPGDQWHRSGVARYVCHS